MMIEYGSCRFCPHRVRPHIDSTGDQVLISTVPLNIRKVSEIQTEIFGRMERAQNHSN